MIGQNTGYAEINGARIYYEAAGQGYPLVFVHAGVADSRMWDDQFTFFAEAYKTIRYDMRGFGNTQPVSATYTNRDDLYALLRHLNVEHAYLVGCSMGGSTIMDFALEHPDMAAALVMVSSGPSGLELDVPTPKKFSEADEAEESRDWARFTEITAQIWFDGEHRKPDQVNQQARARMVSMFQRKLELSEGDSFAGPGMEPSAAKRLAELRLPVFVIYGDQDVPYIQAAGQFMWEHIAGSQIREILDAAHLPNMEHPEEFNGMVLEFLRSL